MPADHLYHFPHHLQIMCLILFTSTETAKSSDRNQVRYSLEILPFLYNAFPEIKILQERNLWDSIKLACSIIKNARNCDGKGLEEVIYFRQDQLYHTLQLSISLTETFLMSLQVLRAPHFGITPSQHLQSI